MIDNQLYDCDGVDTRCLCKLSPLLKFLASRWVMEIISILGNHINLRFNEIEVHLKGISPTTLSRRLQELVQEGYILKSIYAEKPPRVEYSLTRKGLLLWDKLQPLSSL
ncbi:MAG: winged helix-turn-helix transcriptional regulator [Candidatus Kariarchaeaceae archaeon]|jgi:DNA-binding HxlR family transcriptional regulator